jgi:hypothetical protein
MEKFGQRPKFGSVYDNRQACRLRYRKRIREGEKLQTCTYTNELHEALLKKDAVDFWKCWRSKFESSNKCQQVDGTVDENRIAKNFANYFADIYSYNNIDNSNRLATDYANRRISYCGFPMTDAFLFDAELVSTIISKLSLGKAAGVDHLTAEHLLNSHPIVSCILYKLFNVMLLCGYVPAQFGHSYIVPIPKINDDRSKALTVDDFRGIAISPVISKIFEMCILDRFKVFFNTSDNQFGFKAGRGCSQAVYTVRRVVERFVNNGSTMNLCSIDLSKAFDKVNHHALFIKLMDRDVPGNLLTVLENWYSKCTTCVKWNTVTSHTFNINFGVRQGSVLSPTLFAVYVNDIASKLTFGHKYAIILYADDILLLSSSVSELQVLLNYCETELA